jgi:tRNA (guanine37-N1)-methyltransferase
MMGHLNLRCRIKVDADTIYIPINEPVDMGYPVQEQDFFTRDPAFKSYKDAVKDVPEDLLEHLPTSFDTVGDIAIMKMPEELLPHVEAIGKGMLRANPSIRLVAMDMGVHGGSRIRDLAPIAGKGGFETVHVEYGIRMELDISRCYYSPRLATERKRVTDLVRDGERVLDMFAGVGPFSIMIAKNRKVERLWAVDINPVAIEYLRRNIKLNRVSGIEPICADARDVVGTLPPLNRIIMNLPHTGYQFLPDAIEACGNEATIHYYEILKEPEARPAQIEAIGPRTGRTVEVASMREVRSYSPTESHFSFDIRVFTDRACCGPC